MPGLTANYRNSRKRRSASVQSDDDDASSVASTEKRPRLHGPTSHGETSSQDGATEKHKPGSIVRVIMTNFVTYTNAEFKLGPSLNMIIGPNGTGKSTLVCAICLGLGWGPVHLGRAKELGEFVKHGAKEADIEIELAGGIGDRRNPIIRRNIKRDGNKSSFFLNGQMSTSKAIRELARKYSIQVDNLCQFLPQDRVVEFAALSPVDLLAATQQAAASDEMIEWHEDLKKKRGTQKSKQVAHKTNAEQLDGLKKRQDAQRADVDRMKERADTLSKISAYEKYKFYLQYQEKKNQWAEAKEQTKQAKGELVALQRAVQPAVRAMEEKEDYQKQIDAVVRHRQVILKKAETTADNYVRKLQDQENKIEQCAKKIEAERALDKTRRGDLARINNSITNIQRQMQNKPIDFDAAAYNVQIRDRERKLRDLKAQTEEVRETIRALEDQMKDKTLDVRRREEEVQKLHSQAGKQESKLRGLSRDTYAAWDWIQKNQNKFNGTIHGPPIVSCTVKDPSYANAIESVFQRNDFLTITCESRDDYKLLQEQLFGEMRLQEVTVRVAQRPISSWRSPVSEDLLRSYGLDGWLVNFIDGPEAVLSMLCDAVKLHSTGVTLRNHDNAQYERLKESQIQSWVTGKSVFRVTRRREYGAKAVSTMTTQVKPARCWTDQPVDLGVENQLNGQIRELKSDLEDAQKALNSEKLTLADLKGEHKEVEGEMQEIADEKSERQRLYGEFQALPTKLATQEEKKRSLEETGSQLKERIDEINKEQTDLVIKKGQMALDYANAVELLRNLHIDLYEAELANIEALSEVEVLKDRNKEVQQNLNAKKGQIEDLGRLEQQIRQQARELHERVKNVQEETPPEELVLQQQLHGNEPDITPDELQEKIEIARGRLELLHEGDPGALQAYEKRKQEIEKLEKKVQTLSLELVDLQTDIDTVRSQWEPNLDMLVSKISDAFSYNFSKIGCAGQVGVYKDEDFDQWAIQIQVKFRANEPLSILDSHRQSGGERAVSTIFYLMALQSLARSPFRVVDEINQGMDPRNERLVHERMVDIACQEHTSQYFLITPKLLHGLRFHPRMKVHTIMSGEYMPADNGGLDIAKLAQRALVLRGRV